MKYLLFTVQLTLSEFSEELKLRKYRRLYRNNKRFKDEHPGNNLSGSYDRDDANTWNATVRMLQRLYRYADEFNRFLIEDSREILQEFREYLWSISRKSDSDQEKVMRLIEAIAERNLEIPLAELIEEYYNDFIKEDDRGYYALSFEKLYIKIGDRALFLKEDPEIAMRYYRLADLDWFHLRDSQIVERELDEARRHRLRAWHGTVMFYEHLLAEDAEESEFYSDSEEEKECWDRYEEFLYRSSEEEHEKVLSLADDFFEALFRLLSNKKETTESLRSIFLAAHLVRRNAMFSALCCLRKDTKAAQERVEKEVLSCVEKHPGSRLEKVGEYAKRHKEAEDVYESVLLFADAMDIIFMVKDALRVKELEQEMAYYTSLENFFYMLPARTEKKEDCGRLSIMNIAYMNDPNEGKVLQKYLFGSSSTEKKTRQPVTYPYVFMKCFTSRIDDLPMWEMYGNHAEGCCIILDWEASVNGENSKNVPLYRICYMRKNGRNFSLYKAHNGSISEVERLKKNLQRLRNTAQKLAGNADARMVLNVLLEDIVYLFKDSDYSYEQELRIFYNYHDSTRGFRHTKGEYPLLFVQPDFPVKIKEIIEGPKFKNIAERMPYIQEQIEEMCRITGMDFPDITASNIDYK